MLVVPRREHGCDCRLQSKLQPQPRHDTEPYTRGRTHSLTWGQPARIKEVARPGFLALIQQRQIELNAEPIVTPLQQEACATAASKA